MDFRSHVRLGDLDINDTVIDGATPIEILVREVIPHPKYKSQPLENDIALLHLMNPVTFTGEYYVCKSCISTDTNTFTYKQIG